MAKVFSLTNIKTTRRNYAIDSSVLFIICGPENLGNEKKADLYSDIITRILAERGRLYITPFIAERYMNLLSEWFRNLSTFNANDLDDPVSLNDVVEYYSSAYGICDVLENPPLLDIRELIKIEYPKTGIDYKDIVDLHVCSENNLVLLTENPIHKLYSGSIITFGDNISFI